MSRDTAIVQSMRIITTTCSNTEIVHALGCGNLIVAVDDHSDYPPKLVDKLPRVGPDLSIDMDKVAALKPDLVLASLTVPGHEKVVADLHTAGFNVLAPKTLGLRDVYSDITTIANAIDATTAGVKLVEQMQQHLRPITRECSHRLMVQWWPKPIIGAARQSWVHDLIELAGGTNALADSATRSTPLEDNDASLANSDAWIISWCGVKTDKYRPEVLYNRKSLRHCKAVKQRQIFCIAEAHLGRPSQRLLRGYDDLCQLLNALEQQYSQKKG